METKICNSCHIEKELTEFGVNNRMKSGINNDCFICKRESSKISYQKNIQKEQERCREKSKKYRLNNREKVLKMLYIWKTNNKDYINEYAKKYYHNRKENDDLFRLTIRIRGLILSSFRRANNQKYIKGNKTEEILGCDFLYFMNHINSLFKDGMSFNNYGEWELDHKIPISSAKNEEDIIKLNHYSNFQPLWRLENRIKGNKLNYGD